MLMQDLAKPKLAPQILSSSARPFTETMTIGRRSTLLSAIATSNLQNLMADSQGLPSARRALTDSYSDFLPHNCATDPKFEQKASHRSSDGEGDMSNFTGDEAFQTEITKSGDRGFKWNCG